MRTRIRNLGCGKLGAAEASIYTPNIDRCATVKSILLTNTHTAAVTVRIGVQTNGEFIAVAPLDMSIAANDTAYLETPFTLPDFAELHAYASSADKVDYIISGIEDIDAQIMYPELYLYSSTNSTYHQITLNSDLTLTVGAAATPTTGCSATMLYVEGNDGFIYSVYLSGASPVITIGQPVSNTAAVQGTWLYSSAYAQYVLLKIIDGGLSYVFKGAAELAVDYNDQQMVLGVPCFEESPGAYSDLVKAQAFPTVEHVGIMPGGPGTEVNTDWETLISELKAQNIKTYGYVFTEYATRDLAAVTTAIDTFFALYPEMSGIFLDEVDGTDGALSYYEPLWTRVHDIHRKKLILNSGTTVSEGFVNVCDVLMNFEGTLTAYNSHTAASWMCHYSPRKFWHAIHSCAASGDALTAIKRARYNGAGNIIVTDQTMSPYPWYSAPSYWANLVADMANYAAWHPLYVPGCVAWYDATQCTYDGGMLISAVTDQSISARNLAQSTPANKPTYVASGVNSKPVFRFAGSHYIQNATITASMEFTIAVVFKASALDEGRIFGSQYDGIGAYLAATGYPVFFSNYTLPVTGTVLAGTNWKLGIFTFSTYAYYNRMHINDAIASTAASGSYNLDHLALGSGYDAVRFDSSPVPCFNGDILAFGLWDRMLGKEERTNIYEWAVLQLGL